MTVVESTIFSEVVFLHVREIVLFMEVMLLQVNENSILRKLRYGRDRSPPGYGLETLKTMSWLWPKPPFYKKLYYGSSRSHCFSMSNPN